MQAQEGQTLAAMISASPRGLPWRDIRSVFTQCFGILAARADLSRCVTPSTVFVAPDGTVTLLQADESAQLELFAHGDSSLLDYMAPELAEDQESGVDETSGVFCLGACFYHALTGRTPFTPLTDDHRRMFVERWRADRKPTPSIRHDALKVLSREARIFIRRALEADRSERYRDFIEMADAFHNIEARTIAGSDVYELSEFLGRGGFGEVYRAHAGDGRVVAVKWLFQTDQPRRFLKEAKILRDYPHKHMVEYVDFMEVEEAGEERRYFLVLEHLDGMPAWCLNRRISRESGGLNHIEVLELFRHYLECLEHLHKHKIIHRDIKPGNLYAPEHNTSAAKVFDLGIARDMAGTVTTGHVPGTLYYMPPELAKRGGVRGSPQSDIYSLGLAMYEALTGKPPYKPLPHDDRRAFRQFMRRASDDGERIRFDLQIFAQYPHLASIIRRATALEPSDRFPSAREMRLGIEDSLSRTKQHRDVLAAAETVQAIPTLPPPAESQELLPTIEDSGASPERSGPSLAGSTLQDIPSSPRRLSAAAAAGVLLAAVIAGTAIRAILTSPPESDPQPPSQKDIVKSSETQNDAPPEPETVRPPSLGRIGAVRIEVQHLDLDRPLNPPVIVTFRRSDISDDWKKFDVAAGPRPVEPGHYTFRFTRADHHAVSRSVNAAEGDHLVAVLAPLDWKEEPPLFALRRLRTAWTAKPRDTRLLTRALLSPQPDFEWPAHARDYVRLCSQWEALLVTELPAELDKADHSVSEHLRWYFQVKDPTTSLYRRQQEQPPEVSLLLPPPPAGVEEDKGDSWARMQRLMHWQTAQSSLDDRLARRELARKLAELSRALSESHPEYSAICGFDSVILTRKPIEIIAKYRKADEPAFVYCWRAHTMYSPRISSLDALRDLAVFTECGGVMNSYDIQLAVYSAYYTWQNAVDGERAYAVTVNHLFGRILTALTPEQNLEIMTLLSARATGPSHSHGIIALYMLEAMSFMPGLPQGSDLRTRANRWLESHATNDVVAKRTKQSTDRLALLKELLYVSRQSPHSE